MFSRKKSITGKTTALPSEYLPEVGTYLYEDVLMLDSLTTLFCFEKGFLCKVDCIEYLGTQYLILGSRLTKVF